MDKILAWEGSVSIDRVGQGFDFERVNKVDDVYIFFNGPQIYCIYDKNGNYIKKHIDIILIHMIMITMMIIGNG